MGVCYASFFVVLRQKSGGGVTAVARRCGTRQAVETTMIDRDETDDDSLGIERTTFEHGGLAYKDPKVLRTLYWERGWTQQQIGDHFDVTRRTISYWMRKLDIDTRPTPSEGSRVGTTDRSHVSGD